MGDCSGRAGSLLPTAEDKPTARHGDFGELSPAVRALTVPWQVTSYKNCGLRGASAAIQAGAGSKGVWSIRAKNDAGEVRKKRGAFGPFEIEVDNKVIGLAGS